MNGFRATGFLSATALATICAVAVQAQEAKRQFDIAAQPLSAAIIQFSRQSGVVVSVPSKLVQAKRARQAKGSYTPEEALRTILAGSGLQPQRGRSGGYVLEAQGTGQATMGPAVVTDTGGSAAQQSSAPADDERPAEAEDEPIVVTGSRVQRSGFSSPTPVTVVDEADLEARATTNVADYLNDLPSFLPTSTPTTNTVATGGAGNFLNLRALGPERTLILVDGRRHVPTTNTGTVSINVIPTLLIKRVEVVTGGASAAYGSDAVAGVVNLLFDDDLDGWRGEVQAGMAEEGDNEEWRAALAFGTAFAGGRGHISLAVDAFENDGIRFQQDRKWGARNWGIITNPDFAAGNGQPRKLLVPDTGLSIASEGGLILSGRLAGQQFAPDGTLIPFNPGRSAGGLVAQGGDGPYAGAFAVLAVPLKRHTVFARGRYELSDKVTAFAEASYAQQEANNRNLVTPFNFGDLMIRRDNAFLSPAIQAQLAAAGEPGFVLSRWNVDFGFVEANDKVETRRLVGGLKGEFGSTWDWNAYYQHGETDRANIDPGNIITANLRMAADSVIDPATGQPVCRSRVAGCVPINLFGAGAPSDAALDYIHGTARVMTDIEQDVVAASVQGRPFSTWAGPVSVAFGAEYRRDAVETTVDDISLAGGFLIGNQKPVKGSVDVTEGFIETAVPLLADRPGAKLIEVDLAARLTDYSTSGSVTTWKAGLSYAVNDALRFRATRSRDIRAPNVFELFSSSGTGFFPITDPTTGTPLLVRSTLLPNPDLQPERADTTTIGVVLQPTFLPNFRLSADYFDIELKEAIGQVVPQEILGRCLGGATELCGLIERDAAGTIVAINRSQLNLLERRNRGIDVEAQYMLPLSNLGIASNGALSFRLLGTYALEVSVDDGINKIDQAGALAGEGTFPGLPRVRAYGSVRYANGPFATQLGARFVGAVNRNNADAPLTINSSRYPARAYLDASIQYALIDQADRKLQLFASVSNLLDTDPVITGRDAFFSAATNPVYYDVIGRSYNIGARFQF